MPMNSPIAAGSPPDAGARRRLSSQIYLIRVVLGLLTTLLLAVNDAACHGRPAAHPFLLLAGLTYPHLGQLILGRHDPDPRHGHTLFLLDGLYAGTVIAALEFSWLPSLALFVVCLFNWLIVGGARLAGLGSALLLAGALLSGNMTALTAGSVTTGCNATLWLTACLFAGYFLIVARVIHIFVGDMQRQLAGFQAQADAANAARSLAERALLSAFPPSIARQLEVSGKHSPETLPTADLLLIELAGCETLSADLAALQTTWQVCETILARHGAELIKTCGNRGMALERNNAGPKALVAAAKEILTHFSDHGDTSAVESGRPRRVLIHRGGVTLGLVQPARLNLDLSGPGMEALLTLAAQTVQWAPRGLIISPAAFRQLADGEDFAPLPDATDTPLGYHHKDTADTVS